jgi:phosphatidylglycerophosphate synthase
MPAEPSPENTPGYQPTSRRPIADIFRATARNAVDYCIKNDIHPDTVSYASVVAAAAAALLFWPAWRWPWLLLFAPAFLYVRLWCNMLDGMVALASGKASPRGEIVNELPDRVSDVIIFVGVAHSGLCSPFNGYWAAIAALFTAYVGMLGQAVGVHREFSGPMSKPWRMVVLHLGAWWAFVRYISGGKQDLVEGFTVLDLTCLVVSLGCLLTIIIRLRRIVVALNAKHRPAPPPSSQP